MQLGLTSAESTTSGTVVGALWLSTGDVAFPEEDWHDAPVPVLTWWIGALRELVAGDSDEASLRFMDGPFEVRLDRTDPVTIARFLRSGRSMLPEAEIDPDELLASVLENAVQLVATLRGRGVVSTEIDDLYRVARLLS